MSVTTRDPYPFKREGTTYTFSHHDDDRQAYPGDTVFTRNGDFGTFQGIGRIGRLGDPKVIVSGREYNASVWRLDWNRHTEEVPRPC